jgi:hypothetical protein
VVGDRSETASAGGGRGPGGKKPPKQALEEIAPQAQAQVDEANK